MENFYFTYGSSMKMPFQGGWTRVVAATKREAVEKYTAKYPLVGGLINCSDVYDESKFIEQFQESGEVSNLGSAEHEVLS